MSNDSVTLAILEATIEVIEIQLEAPSLPADRRPLLEKRLERLRKLLAELAP